MKEIVNNKNGIFINEKGNIQLNAKSIVRDGELFSRKFGIGFFCAKIGEKYRDVLSEGQEERIIWLAAETQAVSQ